MTIDPFGILGLEPRFAIDVAAVRRRLVTEAARRHPDRAPDPITAAAWTDELARLHEAADRVLDDLDRAEALLALRGGPAPSDDRTLPPGFLESMLAVRMELEEAIAEGDGAGRTRLEAWARDEWAERRAAVEAILDAADGDSPEALTRARHEVNRWRYAQRMLEQLDDAAGGGGA